MESRREEARVVMLRAVEATPESFAPFGQVVAASPDSAQFGPHDAQLDLSGGIPRFYIMRLENQPLKFSNITHHASVTQCLGSIGGQDWYLGVAKPSIVDGEPVQSGQDGGRKPVQSRAGHYYLPPDPAEVCVFRVSGPKFLKLHKGTWHAGPLFKADAVDFYNLELSNTNFSLWTVLMTALLLVIMDFHRRKLHPWRRLWLLQTNRRSKVEFCHLAPRQHQAPRQPPKRSRSSTSVVWENFDRTTKQDVVGNEAVDRTAHYFKKHDGITFVIEA